VVHVIGLLWAVAAAVLYRAHPAFFLAAFLLAATTLLHGGWLSYGVLAALGGAAVTVARLAAPSRREAAWRLVRSPVSLGLALLLGAVWVSFLWNRSGASPAEAVDMLRDAKGLTLGAAVYLAGVGFATGFGRVRMAISGLVTVGLVLGGLRIVQRFGPDVTDAINDLWETTILGDAGQYAQQNAYGVFVMLSLALALYLVLRPARRGGRVVGVLALVAFQWLLMTSASRTAILGYALVLFGLLWLARGRQRRVVLLAGTTFAVILVVYLQGAQKPFASTPPTLDTGTVKIALPPAARRAPGEPKLWSAALVTERLAVVQHIRVPERLTGDDNVLRLFIRFPVPSLPGFLDVDIDGALVRRVTPSRETGGRSFFWLELPVRGSLLDGKEWIRVTLRVHGRLDSQYHYVDVAGGAFVAEGLRSEFFTGYGYLTDDLSNRRGWQRGTYLIFLNESWPDRFQWLSAGSRWALDNSIVERFEWARVALANFADHPVLGSGFGSLLYRAPAYIGAARVYGPFANAHSNFFHLLAELGLVGMVGWLLLVVAPIGLTIARWRRRRTSPLGAAFALVFGGFALAWALGSVAQYSVTDTRLFHLWLFYLGIWAAQVHRGGFGLVPWPVPLGRKAADAAVATGSGRGPREA
jgi:hypothetical protein